MKILLISASNGRGGAFAATNRLKEGLEESGLSPVMLVQKKESEDKNIIKTFPLDKVYSKIKAKLDKIPSQKIKHNETGVWSTAWFPTKINKKIRKINPDIVNLHWINNGMISIPDLGKIKKPIIWTINDMWPFCGGFHYSGKFLNHDGSNLSKWILERKKKYWKNLDMTIVATSSWLAECAKKSELFQDKNVFVIPNSLNEKIFINRNKEESRKKIGLPLNKKIILFGAPDIDDKRKGFEPLIKALDILPEEIISNSELAIFGSNKSLEINFKIKSTYLGRIDSDEELSYIYSAADVMIVPSILEAFGQTASESMACKTPVVCFDATGLKNVVDHKINGYAANPYDPVDLARGIGWVLEDEERRKNLGENARQKVLTNFTNSVAVKKYFKLYKDILKK